MKLLLGIAFVVASASVIATAFWRDGRSVDDSRLSDIHRTASF